MIPNTKDRQLASSGVMATGTFGISLPDAAHLMTILRSTLYSDKVLAVLREYSANAWDAHREAGKQDVPIRIDLPTSMAPNLVIRDYGLGLSPDDVFQVYTQYGASTKRKSNTSVGMLGIGSKSGFAYSDSFTITSWHAGKKSIYGAVLDPSRIGTINLLFEEDCPIEETGIEIQIAARPNDILEFHNKAKNLFQHFDPRPVINIDLPAPPTDVTKLRHGAIINNNTSHGWIAVMGCIPYKIDLTQVQAQNNDGKGIPDYIPKVGGVLTFSIGDIHISASREGLEYSELTRKALIEKFDLLVEEYVRTVFDNINNSSISYWDRRLQSRALSVMRLPIPKKFKWATEDRVKLKKKPSKSSIITSRGTDVETVAVEDDARIVYKDDSRDISGYQLDYHDYLVTKKDDATPWDVIKSEIDAILKSSSISGMPSAMLSTLPWSQPWKPAPKKSKGPKDPKHSAKSFRLADTRSSRRPSRNWELVARTPTKGDVFAIIERFETVGYNIFALYDVDKRLADLFGASMPDIYGYKNTEKKPITEKQCAGTEYLVWRLKFLKSLFTDRVERLYNHWEWSQAVDNSAMVSPSQDAFKKVSSILGARHAITSLFRKQQMGSRIVKKFKKGMTEAMKDFRERLDDKKTPEYMTVAAAVFARYPLLQIYGLDVLWGASAKEWFNYVKLVDQS